MATLLLRAAGTFVGGLIGGPFGAILGAVGSLGGFAIDNALLSKSSTRQGPRLEGMPILNASEGGSIPRVYGYARAGGQIIWATRFREEQSSEKVGGGKGGLSKGTTVQTFSYYANFAVAVCEGPIAGIRRVWADGQEVDLTNIEMRVYKGTATQLPDPLIEAKQGPGRAPAYRGVAYVVFEDLPLESFGNRIPQLSFEVMRPVGKLEPQIEAITVIPGASEFAYSPQEVTDTLGPGNSVSLNRNVLHAASDWEASIDELQALCPNLKRVALIVSWFGTDLRAGYCRVEPRVEVPARPGASQSWIVSGVPRGDANQVSQINGNSAFGGTPSDASVLAAIADLKARGLQVTLYPFLMMDIPAGNGLPDPYGGAQQAVYPWRGRITEAADGTAASRAAVNSFVGSVAVGQFTPGNQTVNCTIGELSYRRLILHYAHLCALAGGVDAFIIGSEMRGLTWLRDANNAFPFVEALQALARDCRLVLGPATGITYAADWSEYFGLQPTDGSGDVFFHLDPLWAEPAISAVGIDNYMPLSDWRGTTDNARNDGVRSAYDAQAMARSITGGEGYDWYYASEAHRNAGARSPISSGDQGDDWLYRYKDLEGWWSSQHFDRRGGLAVASPSAWVPGSKPIWFTELGAPAVDGAANQPNVFPDP
ncbi:MAG: glycoside hydrolase TIM-barrel-like domain-containing protein, partial [Pseudomonadota bacterium]